MKKILFTIILFIIPLALSAQWYGDGKTSSTAYYGIINGSNLMQVWNTTNYPEEDYPGGVIYVGRSTAGQNDLEVGSGGTLTIEEGITVKFCITTSDLRITGTGILNASGSSSSIVTFTKNTQAAWGHISFESMTTTNPENYPSVINNCIIQWGDVSSTSLTPSNPNQFGGAIHADFSYLTISNCEINNNKAGWGGGIFVGDGKNPSISNCYIHDNTATTSGGGLYFWKNSNSTLSNSIITDNNSSGAGGGGGIFIGGTAKDVKVINSVISHNSANNQTLGHNIRIFNNTNTPKPQFINSIIWYPANSIVGSYFTTDFIYCAIQDPPLSYPTCVTLNAANEGTNPYGPYFYATDGTDWSIKVISPCRDAGTTPSPTVPTDYDGNSRVGAYDIGAYEVQYNGWKTDASSTNWETGSNWTLGAPTSSQNVVIPTGASNYPTGSSAQNYTISLGYGMVLDPGAQATLGTLTTTGDLKLRSDASNISSLIINSIDVSATVELYLTGGEAGSGNYRWHYISSPFSTSPSITPFTAVTLNLVEYIESLCTSTSDQGWVAFDGYIYKTGGDNETSFSTLTSGKGYNFYDNVNNEITISGDLENGNVVVGLNFNGNATPGGFNLLGNPFPSGLDWDVIILDASYPDETSKGVYFTRDNAQCSYIGGVGTPIGVTGIIPPMQGFFTKTYSASNTINLLAAARTHNSIHARYKGKTTIPLVRLSISKDSISDETVVRFDEQAKPELDNDFDALKMFLSDDKISIYSFTGETKYAINGQPFPETEVEIPIAVNLISEGDHNISAIQLQGLDNYNVTLKDLVTEFVVDLKTTPELTFTDTAGTYTDRFILTISDATGIEDIHDLPGLFNVFTANNLINIRTLSDAWNGKTGTVKIFDITGKTVSEIHNKEFWKNSILQIPAPSAKGIYFVEIRAGGLRYVGRVSAGY